MAIGPRRCDGRVVHRGRREVQHLPARSAGASASRCRWPSTGVSGCSTFRPSPRSWPAAARGRRLVLHLRGVRRRDHRAVFRARCPVGRGLHFLMLAAVDWCFGVLCSQVVSTDVADGARYGLGSSYLVFEVACEEGGWAASRCCRDGTSPCPEGARRCAVLYRGPARPGFSRRGTSPNGGAPRPARPQLGYAAAFLDRGS